MAYPTHPRHQAAREALEFSKQQQAPQEGGRVETTPGEQQVFEGMGETLTPSSAEEPSPNLMARQMEEPQGPQFEAMQKLADAIDRELSMRQGG